MECDRNRIGDDSNLMMEEQSPDVVIDDRLIRLLCIPAFGIVIPNLTLAFGSLGTGDVLYWLGYVYFISLSFFIWQGNRAFLFRQRRFYNWFKQPAAKVIGLLFANIFYTAPLTVAWMTLWYSFADIGPIDWDVIRAVTLINVICVVFVTHIYETVLLIHERRDDLLRVTQLENARFQAELTALKNQIDPHFLFNSLNTLGWLIQQDTRAAMSFNDSLADMYRYILTHKDRELVSLKEELDFLNHYVSMMQLRFGNALAIDIHSNDLNFEQSFLPPISLQILIENAVKHNEFSEEKPLHIRLDITTTDLLVSNIVNPRLHPRPSSGTGLQNLDERCRLTTGRGLDISKGNSFSVLMPLMEMSA
jgi:sensor histidine kinase YesM